MPGEIAEMMLEGVLCEGCGAYLGEGSGYPVRCAGCSGGDGLASISSPRRGQVQPSKTERARWARQQTMPRFCPLCGRSKTGLSDHLRDAHRLTMTLVSIDVQVATAADLGFTEPT